MYLVMFNILDRKILLCSMIVLKNISQENLKQLHGFFVILVHVIVFQASPYRVQP